MRWIVRVLGKEYGPVDLDELREWKREGRLIRENEIREPESERWIPAGELPELFGERKSRAGVCTRRPSLGAPDSRRNLLSERGGFTASGSAQFLRSECARLYSFDLCAAQQRRCLERRRSRDSMPPYSAVAVDVCHAGACS